MTIPVAGMDDVALDERKIDALMIAARQAGCPASQMVNFLQAGYVPQVKQLEFHAASRRADDPNYPNLIGYGGARGGGKSHVIMAQIALDDCQRRPGIKFLFLRKIQKAAKESFEDLINRVLLTTPHEYHPSEHRLLFPNGSRIIIGGYRDEKEIAGYLGIEYDGIAIEEATLITESKYRMILGSLRTSKKDWRPRAYLSTNPGGVGHAWFRREFVYPPIPGKTVFIRAKYTDNAYLNVEYVDYLQSLPGDLGKAWRDGDWDVFEGQAFSAFNHETHVIDPFPIPQHWPVWRGIDWGFTAPFACLWFAYDPERNRYYVTREVYQTQLTVTQQCRLIHINTPPDERERIHITYADPSMWSVKTSGSVITTTADEYAREGVPLTKAVNDRLTGKRKIDNLLAVREDGLPGLLIFRSCYNLIRTLPLLVHDTNNPEDIDTQQEDHAYDALRYGLSNTSERVLRPAQPQRRRSELEDLFG